MKHTPIDYSIVEPTLRAAGWGVVQGSKILKDFSIPQERLLELDDPEKPLVVDYVLHYKNRNLAVVEANTQQQEHTDGIAKAKKYAKLLDIRFTYSTNGKRFYEIDLELEKVMDLPVFPGPEELWKRLFKEEESL